MVIIIGAGISGLSTGYFLQKNNIPFQIIEASAHTGGYIKSVRENNYLLEIGPNSLLVTSETEAFLNELNLQNQLIEANDVSKDRFIFKNGNYRKLPSSPISFLFGSFFSFSTKIAVLTEFFRNPKKIENESLAAFIERRFCKEIVDYAVAPFISGIYAGNASETNAELAFPQLVKFEKEYGSVLKGFIKSVKTGRKKTVSFKDGLQTLTDKLTELVEPAILRNTKVNSIQKTNSGWQLNTSEGIKTAEKVIIATTAFSAFEMLKENYLNDVKMLQNATYAPIMAVHSVYKKTAIKHIPSGFGGLNPEVEKCFALGSIWSSSVFNFRCPAEEFLFSTFIGGISHPEKLHLSDAEILEKTHAELSKQFGISAKPVFTKISKWEKAIPQYNNYLKDALKPLENLEKQGLIFNVNWKGGIALPDRIKTAKIIAEDLKK